MRIAYVTTYDPHGIHHWSGGLGHYILRALNREGFTVHPVGPLDMKALTLRRPYLKLRSLTKHKKYSPQRNTRVLQNFARQVADRLDGLAVDVILSPGTLPVAYLETALPIVIWTDATFAAMLDFYPSFSNLSLRGIQEGHLAESRALHRADRLVFSSSWAAESAVVDYAADASKIAVIPFGPSLHEIPDRPKCEAILAAKRFDQPKLLMIGFDGQRKNVFAGLKAVEYVRDQGLEAQLDLLGFPKSRLTTNPTFVQHLSFIDKRTPEGTSAFSSLMASEHLLLLPSTADTSPISVGEASAFGVPTLARAVGGISSVVREGLNGHLLPSDSDPSVFGNAILELLSDQARYRGLARSTRAEYERSLSWDSSMAQIRRVLESVETHA